MNIFKTLILIWTFLLTTAAHSSEFLVSTDWLEKNLKNTKLHIIIT